MSISHDVFKGIIAYPVTPFEQSSGNVDIPKLLQIVDRLISSDADVIAPLGSAGEGPYLTEEEWQLVASSVIKHTSKKLPVIVGIAELTTANAIRKAKYAEQEGADALMVIPIAYWKLSDAEIFSHYQAIADAISIPIMVYNNPGTSGVDMQPEFIMSMINSIDNITMVKESSGDIQRLHHLYQLSNGELAFYIGCNYLAFEAFNAGAAGWCTAAPCLIDTYPKQLFNAIQKNNVNEARTIFYKQLKLLEFIVQGGLPATIKAGLRIRGFDVGNTRKPQLPISKVKEEELKQILSELLDTYSSAA